MGPTMATLIQAVDSSPQRTLSVARAMAAKAILPLSLQLPPA